MKKVLIDSDVLLDFVLNREPFSEDAAKVLTLCQNKKIIGCITPVIISNVFYIYSQKVKNEVALDFMKTILHFLDVIVTDKKVILTALNSDFNDFEDAIQNYSAEISGDIDFILTRNTKDYKKSALGVFSPKMFLNNRTTLL
jgi:predicted nucleic acid-binding protein